ncbi:MAG: hypothetical protein WA828_00475 [Coleofasciculaceae cyanobacterium]
MTPWETWYRPSLSRLFEQAQVGYFEQDMHQHVYKENNLLFLRAIAFFLLGSLIESKFLYINLQTNVW